MEREEFCEKISNIAIKSMLYEVAATPKPGLVDRNNSGSHRDMDFFTFLNSISVLSSYFYNCVKAGIEFKGEDYKDLLKDIRPIGIRAEKSMFQSTNGINTHKGIIFSEGIIAVAVGSLYNEGSDFNLNKVIDRVKLISCGITKELENTDKNMELTYGEKLFIKFGVKGIRGEVEEGFKTVLNFSYPFFKNLVEENKYEINDIMVQTLLNLMVYTEDSNILGRHNMDILNFTKESAKKALNLGGIFTDEGKSFIVTLDDVFIKKNISPGGSADLLAVTLMLFMIEDGDII